MKMAEHILGCFGLDNQHNLKGDLHRVESAEALKEVRQRKITGRQFLIEQCDEKIWEDDLNDEGAAFAQKYFEDDYYEDYEETLAENPPSIYRVEDTWENYDKIAGIIAKRFSDMRNNSD